MRKDLPGAETDSEQIIDAIRSILYDALSSYERKKIDLWAIDKTPRCVLYRRIPSS
jgi:hypothetical protein